MLQFPRLAESGDGRAIVNDRKRAAANMDDTARVIGRQMTGDDPDTEPVPPSRCNWHRPPRSSDRR